MRRVILRRLLSKRREKKKCLLCWSPLHCPLLLTIAIITTHDHRLPPYIATVDHQVQHLRSQTSVNVLIITTWDHRCCPPSTPQPWLLTPMIIIAREVCHNSLAVTMTTLDCYLNYFMSRVWKKKKF